MPSSRAAAVRLKKVCSNVRTKCSRSTQARLLHAGRGDVPCFVRTQIRWLRSQSLALAWPSRSQPLAVKESGDQIGLQQRPASVDHRLLQYIPQLPHIPRPAVLSQASLGPSRKPTAGQSFGP